MIDARGDDRDDDDDDDDDDDKCDSDGTSDGEIEMPAAGAPVGTAESLGARVGACVGHRNVAFARAAFDPIPVA